MTEEMKSVKDETIEEEPLPELVQWSKIGGRPTSLRDLSVSDADKLDNVPETGDFGNLAWEDVADEIHIKTGAITETKISDNSISTPKIQSGAITSAKVTTGELITLSAQIKDAIINDAHIDNLSANKITTGELEGITLTGNLIRTSASGGRVVLSDDYDSVDFFDKNGDFVAEISSSSEVRTLTIRSYSTNSSDAILLVAGNVQQLELDGEKVAVGGYLETSSIYPNSDGGFLLGSSSYRWDGIYTMYMRSYGDARVDDDLLVYGTAAVNNLSVSNLVSFSGIPTSDPGNAGVVYRDGNDLRISTG